MGLSDAAFRLCVTARDYSTLMQTDGFIGERLLPALFRVSRMTKKLRGAIDELTTIPVGEQHPLWEKVDGGFRVHDYLDYNLSRVELSERRTEAASGRAVGGRARAAGAQRSGGRFVKGSGDGQVAGPVSDQRRPASSPATPPATPPASTSSVDVSGTSNVEDNVNVDSVSPAKRHQQIDQQADQQASEPLVLEMLEVLGDQHSVDLYRAIARAAPEGLIFEVLSEVKYLDSSGKIRKSRGAVFTDLMKREGRHRGLDVGFGAVDAGPPPRRRQRPLAVVGPPSTGRPDIDSEPDAAELHAALEALGRRVTA